jgi:hypothetical protein
VSAFLLLLSRTIEVVEAAAILAVEVASVVLFSLSAPMLWRREGGMALEVRYLAVVLRFLLHFDAVVVVGVVDVVVDGVLLGTAKLFIRTLSLSISVSSCRRVSVIQMNKTTTTSRTAAQYRSALRTGPSESKCEIVVQQQRTIVRFSVLSSEQCVCVRASAACLFHRSNEQELFIAYGR